GRLTLARDPRRPGRTTAAARSNATPGTSALRSRTPPLAPVPDADAGMFHVKQGRGAPPCHGIAANRNRPRRHGPPLDDVGSLALAKQGVRTSITGDAVRRCFT